MCTSTEAQSIFFSSFYFNSFFLLIDPKEQSFLKVNSAGTAVKTSGSKCDWVWDVSSSRPNQSNDANKMAILCILVRLGTIRRAGTSASHFHVRVQNANVCHATGTQQCQPKSASRASLWQTPKFMPARCTQSIFCYCPVAV